MFDTDPLDLPFDAFFLDSQTLSMEENSDVIESIPLETGTEMDNYMNKMMGTFQFSRPPKVKTPKKTTKSKEKKKRKDTIPDFAPEFAWMNWVLPSDTVRKLRPGLEDNPDVVYLTRNRDSMVLYSKNPGLFKVYSKKEENTRRINELFMESQLAENQPEEKSGHPKFKNSIPRTGFYLVNEINLATGVPDVICSFYRIPPSFARLVDYLKKIAASNEPKKMLMIGVFLMQIKNFFVMARSFLGMELVLTEQEIGEFISQLAVTLNPCDIEIALKIKSKYPEHRSDFMKISFQKVFFIPKHTDNVEAGKENMKYLECIGNWVLLNPGRKLGTLNLPLITSKKRSDFADTLHEIPLVESVIMRRILNSIGVSTKIFDESNLMFLTYKELYQQPDPNALNLENLELYNFLKFINANNVPPMTCWNYLQPPGVGGKVSLVINTFYNEKIIQNKDWDAEIKKQNEELQQLAKSQYGREFKSLALLGHDEDEHPLEKVVEGSDIANAIMDTLITFEILEGSIPTFQDEWHLVLSEPAKQIPRAAMHPVHQVRK